MEAQASLGLPPVHHGAVFGAVVCTASLIELPAMKIAPPAWETPPLEIALDLSYHLVCGIGVAGAFARVERGLLDRARNELTLPILHLESRYALLAAVE